MLTDFWFAVEVGLIVVRRTIAGKRLVTVNRQLGSDIKLFNRSRRGNVAQLLR